MADHPSRRRGALLALASVLVVALGLVAILAVQNRALEARNAELAERLVFPYRGLVVPAFEGVTLSGDSVRIGSGPDSALRQVLLFFTTTCPYCKASIPVWNAVATRGRELGFAVYGVVLDSLDLARAYVAEHGLTYPVVPLPERRLAELYRIRRVPMMLVVDAAGRIRYARWGEVSSGTVLDSVVAAAHGTAGK